MKSNYKTTLLIAIAAIASIGASTSAISQEKTEKQKAKSEKKEETTQQATQEKNDSSSIEFAIKKALEGKGIDGLSGVFSGAMSIEVDENGITQIEGSDEISKAISKAMEKAMKQMELNGENIEPMVSATTFFIGPDGKAVEIEQGGEMSESVKKLLEEAGFDKGGITGIGPAFLSTGNDEVKEVKKEIKELKKEIANQRQLLEQILKKLDK